MPTALEIAQQQADRRLARAGLKPDGSPLNGDPPGGEDETEEEREAREAEEQRLAALAEDNHGEDDEDNDDPRAQEIAELRQQLAALQGRVAPSQRDADDFRRLAQASELRAQQAESQRLREVTELREQLEARDTNISLEEILTEDERANIDPALLETVLKLADAVIKKRTPKSNARAEALAVIEEREQQRVVEHRNKVLTDPARGLHQLSELAYDAKFTEWCKEDDNEVDSVLQSLLNAKSTEEIDRYARIVSRKIARFKEGSKASKGKNNGTDARTRLAAGMRRNPPPRLTAAEADAKFAEAKRLSRSSNPADRKKAQEILADIT